MKLYDIALQYRDFPEECWATFVCIDAKTMGQARTSLAEAIHKDGLDRPHLKGIREFRAKLRRLATILQVLNRAKCGGISLRLLLTLTGML